MKKALFLVATVSAAPALTFDRPASTKVNNRLETGTDLEVGQVRNGLSEGRPGRVEF